MFIRDIILPNKIKTSNLGMGCASLMAIKTHKERKKIINNAIENGIKHFDLARFYGLGEVEKEFTRSADNSSIQITISSKFGILDKTTDSIIKRNQLFIRGLLNKSKTLKKIIKLFYSKNLISRDYSPATCLDSISKSFKELKKSYIDFYFIHEPLSFEQINPDIFNTFDNLKSKNLIGLSGISGNLEIIYSILKKSNCKNIDIIQFEIDNSNEVYINKIEELNINKKFLKIRFGLIRKYLNKVFEALNKNTHLRDYWSNKLWLNLKNKDNLCFVLVAALLSKYPNDILLYSSTNQNRNKNLLSKLNDKKLNQNDKEHFIEFYDSIINNLNL